MDFAFSRPPMRLARISDMRTGIIVGLVCVFIVVTPLKVGASELWGAGGMASLCATLRAADNHIMQSIFKDYLPVIERQGIDLRQTRIAQAKDVLPLLSQAVKFGWSALEFFTDREFAPQGACLLLLDRQALSEVDERYDVHGLWMVNAQREGQQNIAMEYLLLGRGKLIIGYPRQETVKVKDYDLWTGKYTYQPFITMDIVNDPQGRKLANIKTLARPEGEWLPFQGPLDADILSLEVDDDEYVRVTYSKFDEMTDRIHKLRITSR